MGSTAVIQVRDGGNALLPLQSVALTPLFIALTPLHWRHVTGGAGKGISTEDELNQLFVLESGKQRGNKEFFF